MPKYDEATDTIRCMVCNDELHFDGDYMACDNCCETWRMRITATYIESDGRYRVSLDGEDLGWFEAEGLVQICDELSLVELRREDGETLIGDFDDEKPTFEIISGTLCPKELA